MNYGHASFDQKFILPEEPTAYDIAAVQFIYGPRKETNNGDTTYQLSKFKSSEDNLSSYTIWDGGGKDTLDASDLYQNVTINLREGPYHITRFNNVIVNIAFESQIENVIAGHGMNPITLNELDNVIDTRNSIFTKIYTTQKNSGKDIIIGFKPQIDKIYFAKESHEAPLKFNLNEVSAFETQIGNQTMRFDYGVEIKTTNQDILLLANIKKSALSSKNLLRENNPSLPPEVKLEMEKIYPLPLPIEILDSAWDAFKKGTFIVFFSTFSEDVIRIMGKKYKWPDLAVTITLETLKSMLEVYTGTWLSAGISRLTAAALNCIPRFTENADYVGSLLGLGINTFTNTPIDGIRTGIKYTSSLGGWHLGTQLGFWAKKKLSNFILPDEMKYKKGDVRLKKLV